MCTTRWHSLQAKLARTSLRLMTLQSRESPLLYAPWPWTLYKGSQGTHLDTFWVPYSFILHRSRAPKPSLRATRLLAQALLPLLPFLHPHCKNFRAFKRGTCTQSSLRLDVGLQPEQVQILVSIACYHRITRAVWQSYKFTSLISKTLTLSIFTL
jgi:hypothetical protein